MSKAVELLAIPNVSEGRDAEKIAALVDSARVGGAFVLDVHSDARHNRSVITLAGSSDQLVAGVTSLALRCIESIDLRDHEGVHPRLGALDVCPFVPWRSSMSEAVIAAALTADAIGHDVGIPVYTYGAASPTDRQLPDLRRIGLAGLTSPGAPEPDAGERQGIEDRTGVVCVGARGPLIAFNVWLEGSPAQAKEVASEIRGPALRALGLSMAPGTVQVSMNLISPDELGIDAAFDLVGRAGAERGMHPVRTELVGLAFQRHLPDPDAQAARLMSPPGRSYETALEELQGG